LVFRSPIDGVLRLVLNEYHELMDLTSHVLPYLRPLQKIRETALKSALDNLSLLSSTSKRTSKCLDSGKNLITKALSKTGKTTSHTGRKSGELLGYDIVSYKVTMILVIHGFVAVLKKDMNELIRDLEQIAMVLIDSFVDAKKVEWIWIAEDEGKQSLRAESEPYDFWLLVYPEGFYLSAQIQFCSLSKVATILDT